MSADKLVAPVLKWVGGKRQLLNEITPLLPCDISTYCEPFIGGGALLFHLQPSKVIINDINEELISLYTVIKDDVEGLISELEKHRNTAENFYAIRELDRNREIYNTLSNVEKAARLLYLNKTCFNGLYRVNNKGEFNVPFGRYRNPNIVNAQTLRAVSTYFNSINLCMTTKDYASVLKTVPDDAFVYLDPPYDPISETSSFTSYTKLGFSKTNQIELRECCDALTSRGVKFILSNSATDFILDQYSNYNITIVQAKRSVNSNSLKRGCVSEVLVRNYE